MENRIVWTYKNIKNKRIFTYDFKESDRKDMEEAISKYPDFVFVKEEIISDEERLKAYDTNLCFKIHIDKGDENDNV